MSLPPASDRAILLWHVIEMKVIGVQVLGMNFNVCGQGVPPMPTMKVSAPDCESDVTAASVVPPESGLKLCSATTVILVPLMLFLKAFWYDLPKSSSW